MSIAVHQRVVRDFPGMTAEGADLQNYSGFLHVRSAVYRVRVTLMGVCGDAALSEAVAAAPAVARRRIAAAQDPHAILVELRDVLERASLHDAVAPLATDLPRAAFYEGLLRELEEIGWDNVAFVDEPMRNLRLRVCDLGKRTHEVSLVLPAEYPATPPTVSAALPEQFTLTSWTRDSSNLAEVLTCFRAAVDRYQSLFNAMDDFDEHCWVLEPERPLRSDVHRRIAIGKHSSLLIELDPREPLRSVPECRFLGSDAAVGPLRTKLNENMRLWVTSGNVFPRANLETVLSLTLAPSPLRSGGVTADDMGLECGICYTYRLEDRVPELACDRASCAKPFHKACLLEWLKALPDTRQSFETLFGSCPYCEHHISVSAM